MDAAGAVLDDDQDIEATEQHGVHVNEVDREDAVGLGGQELPPGRTRPPRCGTEPGIMQDLPHTVELAMGWPSLTSSLWTRRCHHVGFSVAMRITSFLIAAGVDGRPGRRRPA